jgi:hypothetical protein
VRIFRKDGTPIKEFQVHPDDIRLGVKVSTGRIGKPFVVEGNDEDGEDEPAFESANRA